MHDDLVARVRALEKLTNVNFSLRDRATKIATISLNRRLEGMNQFREQLNEQSRAFITRPEHDFLANQINQAMVRITAIETRFYLGGAAVLIIITAVQLLLNYLHT